MEDVPAVTRSSNRVVGLFAVGLVATLFAEVAILAAFYLRKSQLLAGGYGFPLDDSWIHAEFARNMARGSGFVYNQGQPVSSTTVLYTLMLALAYKVRVAPVFDAVALGLVLHLGSAVLVYGISRRLGVNGWVSALGSVLFAGVPRLMWGALGGMEVPLYVFLVCLGTYAHLRYRWHDGIASYASTASFALAALARPECAVLFPTAVIDRLFTSWRFDSAKGGARRFLRSIPLHIVVFCVILLPAVLFNMSYSGKPLPPAFYAKTASVGGGAAEWCMGHVQLLGQYLVQAATACKQDNVILALGLLPGVPLCLYRARRPEHTGMLFLPMALVAVPAATSVFALTTAVGPQLLGQNGRYSGYLVPLMCVIGAFGWQTAVDLASRRYSTPQNLRLGIAVIVALGALRAMDSGNRTMAVLYGYQVSNINSMQVKLGKWARRLPSNAVIAVNDAGAIAYFSRHSILDVVGVVNPAIVPYLRQSADRGAGLMAYLRKTKPDYLIIFPEWYPELASMTMFEPIASVRLENNVSCGGDTMVVYRANWQAASTAPGN